MTLFEKFDQIEARFAKIFAAIVFCLVATLIVVDIVGAAFSPPPAPDTVRETPKASECQITHGGTRICDVLPPQKPQ